MRIILPIAALAAGLAIAGAVYAQSSSSSGTVGTNVGMSLGWSQEIGQGVKVYSAG
jgi:hypothetical protein